MPLDLLNHCLLSRTTLHRHHVNFKERIPIEAGDFVENLNHSADGRVAQSDWAPVHHLQIDYGLGSLNINLTVVEHPRTQIESGPVLDVSSVLIVSHVGVDGHQGLRSEQHITGGEYLGNVLFLGEELFGRISTLPYGNVGDPHMFNGEKYIGNVIKLRLIPRQSGIVPSKINRETGLQDIRSVFQFFQAEQVQVHPYLRAAIVGIRPDMRVALVFEVTY